MRFKDPSGVLAGFTCSHDTLLSTGIEIMGTVSVCAFLLGGK